MLTKILYAPGSCCSINQPQVLSVSKISPLYVHQVTPTLSIIAHHPPLFCPRLILYPSRTVDRAPGFTFILRSTAIGNPRIAVIFSNTGVWKSIGESIIFKQPTGLLCRPIALLCFVIHSFLVEQITCTAGTRDGLSKVKIVSLIRNSIPRSVVKLIYLLSPPKNLAHTQTHSLTGSLIRISCFTDRLHNLFTQFFLKEV